MKLFSYLYNKTIKWSSHSHAPFYLAGVSFAESSFFPIPPDAMLITMGLANAKKSWNYALITTCFSVLGGIFGYLIGWYCIDFIQPWLVHSSMANNYQKVIDYFHTYGIAVIFLASFSPVPPYKIFTITAGALQMAFFPFIAASFFGRGLRFFTVSALMFFLGDKINNNLKYYIDWLGWGVLLIIGSVLLLLLR